MRKITLLAAAAVAAFGMATAQEAAVNSDYWAATDAIGRSLGTYRKPVGEKTVVMFYWTWHNAKTLPATEAPRNISQILKQYPEAINDANHPAWRRPDDASGYTYWWEEPLLGYYLTTDTWVLRRHAEMLADAKVDAVFFDCTNSTFTWDESTDSLLKTWEQARLDGVKVPKIGFLLPFAANGNSLVSLRHLYERIYKKGLYKDLWFYWDGKPCIMAYPDNLTSTGDDPAIRAFFTFRPGQPDYVNGPDRNYSGMQWPWLENYPQHGYNRVNDQYEMVSVGVAQNTNPERNGHAGAFNTPNSQGRSYSKLNGFDKREEPWLYGYNFAEQWERVYRLNPKAVFITGWNEFIAGMWFARDGWNGVPFSFVDQFDWDHSRDLEPVKAWGDKGDVYYMQLVDRVRRFKGTDAQPEASAPVTIDLNDAGAWNDVQPYFASYRGNTKHRDAEGDGNLHYVNTSGRNDIVGARVARDAQYLYFMVKTDSALTPSTDKNWMMLLVDVDRDKATGWNGYDYIVNYHSPKNGKAQVEKNSGNKWEWQQAGEADMNVLNGNMLVLRMPLSLLGLQGQPINIEFKWSDNMQDEGNIMDFYVNGDVAPGGRFNYCYSATAASGVEDVRVAASGIKATRSGGNLVVELNGVNEAQVQVLDMQGRLLGQRAVTAGGGVAAASFDVPVQPLVVRAVAAGKAMVAKVM